MCGVSAEGHMSECPTAIVIAQPGRRGWALEEAWDLAATVSRGHILVKESRFPGVILLFARGSSPLDVSRAAARMEFGFVQRIVPSVSCFKASSEGEVLEKLRDVLRSLRPAGKYRVFLSLRGSGKSIVGKSRVEELLRSTGVVPARGSSRGIAVESVDDVFIFSIGIIRACGSRCILLYYRGVYG